MRQGFGTGGGFRDGLCEKKLGASPCGTEPVSGGSTTPQSFTHQLVVPLQKILKKG